VGGTQFGRQERGSHRGVSLAVGSRSVRGIGERLEEQHRWESEWSPRHKATQGSSWQRLRVRRGAEMAFARKELAVDGVDGTTML
jgi:hypothetical protein